jgi:hypothetical protein
LQAAATVVCDRKRRRGCKRNRERSRSGASMQSEQQEKEQGQQVAAAVRELAGLEGDSTGAVSAAVGEAVGALSALGLTQSAAGDDGLACHELSDEELCEVARLKALCDEQSVAYASVFELCRFMIGVSVSPALARVRPLTRSPLLFGCAGVE